MFGEDELIEHRVFKVCEMMLIGDEMMLGADEKMTVGTFNVCENKLSRLRNQILIVLFFNRY